MEIADDGGMYEQRCARSAQATGYFVLRPKADQPRAKMLLGLSTNAYAAYNNWGGFSLYAYHGRGGVQGIASRSNALIAGYFPAGRRPLCSG